ncbi:MAG: beta-hydroxyacyl-ACP dehydratase [Thermoguttaceae bacterium]|nr:beta-hydroxyacyl-ACP dehydratase [Thermoguttaceae bacterium]MCR5358308.1 beta-hydroxyacyl-ACP dehydratase [Thermoguttaceae bacterium]
MSEFTKQTILDLIPHRPPFLFVDEIRELSDEKIVAAYRFKEDEFFFQGHYPGRPLVPGVILCEAAMQAGAVYLASLYGKEVAEMAENTGKKLMPVVGRIDEVKFKKIVGPGDVIETEVVMREKMARAYFLNAKITSGGELVSRFRFACTYTES